MADLELRHTQLEKDFQVQRKQLETIKTRVYWIRYNTRRLND